MILENDVLRVELDPGTGGFLSIVDKRFGHDYVAASDRALLLRLMIPEGENAGRHVDGVSPEIVVDGGRAVLRYCSDEFEAEAVLTLDGDAIDAELRLTNVGSLAIEEVIFPWVRGVGAVEDGAYGFFDCGFLPA